MRFVLAHVALVDEPIHLFFLRAVNDDDAGHGFTPAAAFQQKRNAEDDVGRRDLLELFENFPFDHRVKNAL